jgi:Tuberculosis necrotizing toxin
MKLRSWSTAVLAALLLTGSAPVAAQAAVAEKPCGKPAEPKSAPATTTFYDGQAIFGPKTLPTARPVGPLLTDYRRFGNLTQEKFVATFREGNRWKYPDADGFYKKDNKPVRYAQALTPGSRIDRFGFPGGGYLSPAGTPFPQRALPPQNLNTPADSPLSNYHLYCVAMEFTVDAGPIAPWFAQPGMGQQYKLEMKHLPKAGKELSVAWLIKKGYLVEKNPA